MKSIWMSFLFSAINLLFAQVEWTKYNVNPVLPGGAQPTVIFENDTFKMWYSKGDSTGERIFIHYATSTDGIEWTLHPEGTLPPGDSGAWDSKVRDTPCVIKDPYGYKLWYTGADHIGPPYNDSLTLVIGFATSDDGINWNVWQEPVLLKGPPGSWDAGWIESPAVIYEDGVYKMWYTGISEIGQIGYATSPNGWDWEKYPSNPVLQVGEPGSGEDFLVGVCSVIKRDTLYEMWYAGISFADITYNDTIDTVNIGYATSTNGVEWNKYENNPVLTTYYPTYDPDSSGPWAPTVLLIGEEYKMWYEMDTGIGLATAPLSKLEEIVMRARELIKVIPNPSTGYTLIEYSIPEDGFVELRIYDVGGRLKTLIRNYRREGKHTLPLDIRNWGINSSGIYFIEFKFNSFREKKKLVIIK
jgi:predicted GH43/DUF377 family glycosyl hydrolase